ncbi:MAG: hypothetical protein K6G30_13060 [Acetatifactor sp.]|nr:hypothetical protein [Acetatifactor sp.]
MWNKLISRGSMLGYSVLMIMVLIICMTAGEIEYVHKKIFQFSNWYYLVVGLIGIMVIGLVGIWLEKKAWFQRCDRVFVAIICALLFVTLVFVTHYYYFHTGWDAGLIAISASTLADGMPENLSEWYFSVYPNNIFITIVFSVVIRLGRLTGALTDYNWLVIFQSAGWTFSAFLVYMSAEKLSGRKSIAVSSWLLMLAIAGVSPWVTVPYSDSMGLFWTAIVLYLFAYNKGMLPMGFFLATGYFIKPHILIMGIAMLITQSGSLLKNRKRVALVALGFLLGIGTVKGGEIICGFDVNPERTFGVKHFLMLGLNEEYNGVINIEDQDFSMAITTKAERDRANMEVARQRLEDMSFGRLLTHLRRKILTAYNDGSFAWWCEGEFYLIQVWTGSPKLEKVFRQFYYPDGRYYNLFLNYGQSIWIGSLFVGAFAALFKKNEKINVFLLTMIGYVFYEMIFEPRARHLLTAMPIWVILVSVAMFGIFGMVLRGMQKIPFGNRQ